MVWFLVQVNVIQEIVHFVENFGKSMINNQPRNIFSQ